MAREKSPQTLLLENVKNRFAFHPATEVTGPQHDAVRRDLGRVAQGLAKLLPDGREKSLTLTHLEEAMFWANAAIARHPAESSADPAPQPVAEKPVAKKTTRRVTRRTKS